MRIQTRACGRNSSVNSRASWTVMMPLLSLALIFALVPPSVASELPNDGNDVEETPANEPTPQDIEALIQSLNSPNFSEREVAEQQILKLGPTAIEALAEAAISDQTEIAWRATKLLEQVALDGDESVLVVVAAKLQQLSATGRADLQRKSNTLRQIWKRNRAERAIASMQQNGARINTSPYYGSPVGGPIWVGGGDFGGPIFIEEVEEVLIDDLIDVGELVIEEDMIRDLEAIDVAEMVIPIGEARPDGIVPVEPVIPDALPVEEDEAANEAANNAEENEPIETDSGSATEVVTEQAQETTPTGTELSIPKDWIEIAQASDDVATTNDVEVTAANLLERHRNDTRKQLAILAAEVEALLLPLTTLPDDLEIQTGRSDQPITDGEIAQAFELPQIDEPIEAQFVEPVIVEGGGRIVFGGGGAEVVMLGGGPWTTTTQNVAQSRSIILDQNWKGDVETLQLIQEIDNIYSVQLIEQEITADMIVELAMLETLNNLQITNSRFDTVAMTAIRRLRPELTITTSGPAYLGINADLASDSSIRGCKITNVVEESAAFKAGLRVDDVIVRIDRNPVVDFPTLTFAIANRQIGQVVEVEVMRGEKTFVTRAKLGDRNLLGR